MRWRAVIGALLDMPAALAPGLILAAAAVAPIQSIVM